jgi:hypothetical protein
VFFDPGQAFKGQLWLNGHNVGRFWQTGRTQRYYYLPRARMQPDNELLLFDESGRFPKGPR